MEALGAIQVLRNTMGVYKLAQISITKVQRYQCNDGAGGGGCQISRKAVLHTLESLGPLRNLNHTV